MSYLYRGIAKGLHHLAIWASYDFKDLKEVVIGVASGTKDCYNEEIQKTQEVGTFFDSLNIRFIWTIDALGADARTMMPGAFAGSRLIPVPGLSDRKLLE